MENVGIFYGHVWPFGVVCGPFVILFPFWYVWTKKNLATLAIEHVGIHM
jgi:hypothetical protein